MNGELYQLLRLVLYVKDSMRGSKGAEFKRCGYEHVLTFSFSPDIDPCAGKKCNDESGWVEGLEKRKLKAVNLLCLFEKNDPKLAGFANAEKQGIVTEYEDGTRTIWTSKWAFNKERKGWAVYYIEKKRDGLSDADFIYLNCRDEFEEVLLDIRELAQRIGARHFAQLFGSAYEALTSPEEPSLPEWSRDTMPGLNGDALRLYAAASRADVFGGMGSWNDDPSGMAYAEGLSDEYDRLSNALYVVIRKAVMTAANSW